MNRIASAPLLLALASSSLVAGCAVDRVSGHLPSDPIVDWSAVPLTEPTARRAGPSDEDVARAVHLLLEGRLADLEGDCDRGRELIGSAAPLSSARLLEEALRDHAARCDRGRASSGDHGPAVASR